MTETSDLQLRRIRRALISVSDKTGIVDFARELARFDVEIISTGGTAKTLREAGISVRDISEVTGFPEMMDGRVKTLHPRVHGGLLAIRDNPEHVAAMQEHGIEPIDLVVVNLYPFAETIRRAGVTRAEAIEQIDIGGPAMIRSAAKNARDVAVVVLAARYESVLNEMRESRWRFVDRNKTAFGAGGISTNSALRHDRQFLPCLRRNAPVHWREQVGSAPLPEGFSSAVRATPEDFSVERFHGQLPVSASWTIGKIADLRYGENPHQIAALYQMATRGGVANAEVLSGKEMSFNNYVDADAAWALVNDFDQTACAIIKHTNPAGVGLGATVAETYKKALATDPVSAFGGIVAFNRVVDAETAQEVIKVFTEVLIAPDYDAAALEILQAKKNLRILRLKQEQVSGRLEFRHIRGGMLVQTADDHKLDAEWVEDRHYAPAER